MDLRVGLPKCRAQGEGAAAVVMRIRRLATPGRGLSAKQPKSTVRTEHPRPGERDVGCVARGGGGQREGCGEKRAATTTRQREGSVMD